MTRSLSDGERDLLEDRRIDEEAAFREFIPTEAELRQEYKEAAGAEAGMLPGGPSSPPRASAEVYANLVRLWDAR